MPTTIELKRTTWHWDGKSDYRYGWEGGSDGEIIDPNDPRPDGYKKTHGMFSVKILAMREINKLYELEYIVMSAKFSPRTTYRFWGTFEEILNKLDELKPVDYPKVTYHVE
jgi:hypothetical protein